ncbi:hypothetical protein CRI70_20485 [Streptomyces sp. Ru87]|uniref:ATP-binding protein n=1 Tax=Streptomyces lycii TaxID=2654337 RepID=A0ABQ7FP29_9ACTN|nr:ATP-binding protein [Streptomyces lycii]PGH48936.1 hypothetical protein CRI70_20485 [Streptomyces sp. Ru87]
MLKTTTTPGGGEPQREEGEGEVAADADAGAGRGSGARFDASPRGARLARRFAVRRLDGWGFAPESDTSCTVALLVGELAANAVRHGRVDGRPDGRDFRLRIGYEARARVIRVEVSDASAEGPGPVPADPGPDGESGRGLLLVDALADRWGVGPRRPPGKTVWAELSVPGPPSVQPGPAPQAERAVRPGQAVRVRRRAR